jgi:hypothetical protein
MSKAQEFFQKDITADAFQAGCVRGRWGLYDDSNRPDRAHPIVWPNTVIWIRAAPRPKSPDRYYFHFDLEDYPRAAPTSYCWDPVTRAVLAESKWPHSRDAAELTFRQNWPGGGRRALYAPWDRVAQEGHGDWSNLTGQIWHPERHTIVDYSRFTSDLLNAGHYTGTYEAANP